MEASARKVTEHAEQVFSSIEKEFVRKSQREMFLCSAKCLENSEKTTRDCQSCLENCQRPFEKLANYISGEANKLQNRLERCSLDCQDKAQEKRGNESNEVIQKEFESCLEKCASTCIAGMPDWHKRLRKNILNNSF